MTTYNSITELTLAIKVHLEGRFGLIRVKGEVTNLREQASGHLYFSLKDEHSQISAVLFRGTASKLKELPKIGDEITVEGEISLYAPRGSYQLIVHTLEKAGEGALLLKFHALKKKLDMAGYFLPERKKPLPTFPKKIGVVTSPTGAVIRDIIHVLDRRAKGYHLILGPVRVQGKGAAEEIAAAIDRFNEKKLVDVLIVGRGGGSLEDLWPFNEECVADAIYRSTIPVISAVGHETDVSICDFVADVRAPTPSAAAEIVVKELSTQLERLKEARIRLHAMVQGKLKHARTALKRFSTHPYFTSPYGTLGIYMQKLDEITTLLNRTTLHRLDKAKEKFRALCTFHQSINLFNLVKQRQERLHRLIDHLAAIDPKNVLKKGYCIPFSENRESVIMSTTDLKIGKGLSLLFHDGVVDTTVREIQWTTTEKVSKTPTNA